MRLIPLAVSSLILVFHLSTAIGQTKASEAEQKLNIYLSSTLFSDYLNDNYGVDPFVFRLKNRAVLREGRAAIIKKYEQDEISFDTIHQCITRYITNHPNKFDLASTSATPKKGDSIHEPWIKGPGDPCTNMDFETCDHTGWELYEGEVDGTAFGYINVVPNTSTDQHIITTAGTDPNAPISMINPNGGTCSARIGDGTLSGYGAASLVQTFLVSPANTAFQYSYAAVLQDPAGHTVGEKPFFSVRMYDSGGNPIVCGEYQAYGGDGQAGWVNTGTLQYIDWTTVYAPLGAYVGQDVTIEFIVGDCGQGGHYGYAYVDASCNPVGILSSAPSACASTSDLTAPAGASAYEWLHSGETTQTVTVTTSGTYECVLIPFNGAACADTLSIDVTLSDESAEASFTMAPNPACENETVSFTDLSTVSGTGAGTINQWDWTFGDGGTDVAQNPTYAYATQGNYPVTLTVTTTSGCTDDTTINMVVNPLEDATITPAGPFCESDPVAIMTAVDPGGVWSATCGACIDAAGNFDPAAAGTGSWDITYGITGACGDTNTTTVVVETVSITSITPSDPLCAGSCDGTIDIVAPGATQFSIDNGTSFQGTGNFLAQCAGNYDIVVESAIGCQATGTTTLVDPTPVSITFSAFDATCFGSCDGDAIVIPAGGTVSSGYNYDWLPAGTASSNSPSASALCAGTYSLTVTDDHGCSADTLNWVINEPPQVLVDNVTPTDEICANDCQGALTITSGTAVTYEINGPGGTQSNATGNFTALCSGNYDITVYDAAGCPATSTGTVGAPTPVTLNVSPDTTICINGSATISANTGGGIAPVTVTWDNGLGTGNSHVVAPATTTVYTAVATDDNGCASTPAAVIVTLNPALNVIALSDQSICPGTTTSISALANGGDGGPYTYNWDNGLGAGSLQNVTPGTTTTYTVTADDGCETPSATASVTITILPSPVVDFTPDTVDGCTPVFVEFTDNGQPAGTNCFWDFGDGTGSSDCGTVSHTFTDAGCYDVTLSVVSPDGCPGSVTYPSLICVYPYPTADFSFGPQPTTVVEPEIQFTNESTGAVDYFWTFNPGVDPASSTDINPLIAFPDNVPGTYDVCLTATTTFGCEVTTCDQVIIDPEFLLYTPNAFTPDGDGINDEFMPVISGADPEDYLFMIFNRWGELIWQTDLMGKGWDGRVSDHSPLVQEDVYVWKLIARDIVNREKHEYMGHVSLLK